ncbi:MAG: tRNA (guanine-N(7)-)-methyltransferase [Thiotrichales bacterium]|nr:tRNA (guanine-N(7)-)-methyltransferase [Thiotrichales bacterium]
MQGNSAPVSSRQSHASLRIEPTVQRRCNSVFQRPVHPGTARLLERIERICATTDRPLILDSGCGNGRSCYALAERHPDHWVIGVDKSAQRLRRYPMPDAVYRQDNLILARADLVDFWRLARRAGWRLHRYCLFYPNPWPKEKHLFRRWHVHPVFPELLALGGRLALRSNWLIYVQEFALALCAQGIGATWRALDRRENVISPFEWKYRASGHTLYQLVADLA